MKVGFVKKEEEEKEIKVSPFFSFCTEREISQREFSERERERERERELIVSELEDFGV